jgi:hypothetical protein
MFLSKHRDKSFCGEPRQTVSHYIVIGTELKLSSESEFQMNFLEESYTFYHFFVSDD